MARGVAVFFDIGDTLASPVVEGGHLAGLDVYPLIPDVLARLRATRGPHGARVAVGLASNTGAETAAALRAVLDASGLAPLVDEGLCLFSSVQALDKSQPAFFARAGERAALPAARCVYVGESEAERAVAAAAGFAVSPHPLHALHLVAALLPVTTD